MFFTNFACSYVYEFVKLIIFTPDGYSRSKEILQELAKIHNKLICEVSCFNEHNLISVILSSWILELMIFLSPHYRFMKNLVNMLP